MATNEALEIPVRPRDIAPNASLSDQTGREATLNGRRYAGKPLLLCFIAGAEIEPRLAALALKTAVIRSLDAELCAVTGLSVAENHSLARNVGVNFDILSDTGGHLKTAYVGPRNTHEMLSFLVGRSFRVRHIESSTEPEIHMRNLIARLADLRAAELAPQRKTVHAPVLLVPEVLEPEFCVELQKLGEQHFSPGAVTRKVGDASHILYDENLKRRLDYDIVEESTLGRINLAMNRRLLPEVYKAFGFQVRRAEHFRIGCYDSREGGFFTAHRDNVSPATKYRKFAMSINLNTGEYEGGDIQFPEYGPGLYRPDVGEAVVFSCSLLHQALPVTEGRRFVLLSFFA